MDLNKLWADIRAALGLFSTASALPIAAQQAALAPSTSPAPTPPAPAQDFGSVVASLPGIIQAAADAAQAQAVAQQLQKLQAQIQTTQQLINQLTVNTSDPFLPPRAELPPAGAPMDEAQEVASEFAGQLLAMRMVTPAKARQIEAYLVGVKRQYPGSYRAATLQLERTGHMFCIAELSEMEGQAETFIGAAQKLDSQGTHWNGSSRATITRTSNSRSSVGEKAPARVDRHRDAYAEQERVLEQMLADDEATGVSSGMSSDEADEAEYLAAMKRADLEQEGK